MSNYTSQRKTVRRHTKDSEKNHRVPSLRLHKASGHAYVVLSGKAFYCGKPGVAGLAGADTEQRYHRALAEWMAAGRQLPADPNTIAVKELLARFWTHAEQYYRTLTDGRSKELEQFRLALRPMKELAFPASELGHGNSSVTVRRDRISRRSAALEATSCLACENGKRTRPFARQFHW